LLDATWGRWVDVSVSVSRCTGAVSDSDAVVGRSAGRWRHAPVGGRAGAGSAAATGDGAAAVGGASSVAARCRLPNGQNLTGRHPPDEMRSLIEPISVMNC
jgi:hypothetical protein